MRNQHRLQVIFTLIFNFISSGYCEIQRTGRRFSPLHFQLPENGNMTIGYRRYNCVECSFLIIFSDRCSDDYMYIRVKFAQGGTESIYRRPKCGRSSWSIIQTSQKGITIDGEYHDMRGDGSDHPLNGANLTVSSTYVLELKILDRSQIKASTQAPMQNTQVILGAVGGGVGILILTVIIIIAVLCYRKKRQGQEGTQNQDALECPVYEDVANTNDAIYMDVINKNRESECIYEN